MNEILDKKVTKSNFQIQTALGGWMLFAKIILFLELIEYAIVMQIRFANVTTILQHWSKGKKSDVVEVNRSEVNNVINDKCKKIDSWAFHIFLLGSIIFNIVYFTYYTCL